MNCQFDVGLLLLEAGARDLPDSCGRTTLMKAAHYGHAPVVQWLLEAGAPTDLRGKQGGTTALLDAASFGHSRVVHLLLQAGARKDLCDGDGTTALMFAARGGHSEVLQVLLEAGARCPAGFSQRLQECLARGRSMLRADGQKDLHDDACKPMKLADCCSQLVCPADLQKHFQVLLNAARKHSARTRWG